MRCDLLPEVGPLFPAEENKDMTEHNLHALAIKIDFQERSWTNFKRCIHEKRDSTDEPGHDKALILLHEECHRFDGISPGLMSSWLQSHDVDLISSAHTYCEEEKVA